MDIRNILQQVRGLASKSGGGPDVVPGSPVALQNAADTLTTTLKFSWRSLDEGTVGVLVKRIPLKAIVITAEGKTGYVYSRRIGFPSRPAGCKPFVYEVGAIAEDELPEVIRKQGILTAMALSDALKLVGEKAIRSSITKRQEAVSINTHPNRLSWILLPPGEHPFLEILRHLEALRKSRPTLRYDKTRLERICELSPSATYVGAEEFSGYVVFYFEEALTAVLDCPFWGNAIYLIRSEWETLSRLSKAELLTKHTQTVRRIIHSGDWFERLRRNLRQVQHS